MCEIYSKLTIKKLERRRRRSVVFIVNFEHISHLFIAFLLLTLDKQILAGICCKTAVAYFYCKKSLFQNLSKSLYNVSKNVSKPSLF